jgi:multimeric flavodoxin WrbA
MKVLLINGSPRKGNTFNALQKFEAGLIDERIDTELVSIRDYKIEECVGCFKCVTGGKNLCPFYADDADKLWWKIAGADGVVLAAPVFALGVPGIFKNFMDRIAYNAHRPEFYNKPAVLLSTTAGMGTENVFKQLQWFEIAGLRVVSKVGLMVYPVGEDSGPTALKKNRLIEKSVLKLIAGLTSEKVIKPKLIQVIQFYGLKLNCAFGKDIYTADFEYFTDRDFFTDVRVNPIKRMFGKMVYAIGTAALKSAIQKN